MGLLGSMIAGAAEEGGRAGAKIGLAKIESDIAEERAKRLAEFQSGLQEKAAIGTEQRGLINDQIRREQIRTEMFDNADAMRSLKVEDAMALVRAQDEYSQNPKNVTAKAEAAAAAKRIAATSDAALTASLLKDPQYAKNLSALALANHPEKAASIAASMKTLAVATLDLKNKQELSDAKGELAIAMRGGDPADITRAKDVVKALEWTTASDRVEQSADAATLKTLESMITHTEKGLVEDKKLVAAVGTDPKAASTIETKERIKDAEKQIAAWRAAWSADHARYRKKYGGGLDDDAPPKSDARRPLGQFEKP